MKAAPPAKAASAKPPSSPFKRKVVAPAPDAFRKKKGLIVKSYFVNGFNFELFEILKATDGYEPFTHHLREIFDNGQYNDKTSDDLDCGNFLAYVRQRHHGGENRERLNKEGHAQNFFLRFLKEGQVSTTHTRKIGYDCMAAFLQDKNFTSYPPKQIHYEDCTTEDASLDKFMLHDDIEKYVKMYFEEEFLTEDFVANFSDQAPHIYNGAAIGDFARSLGYSE